MDYQERAVTTSISLESSKKEPKNNNNVKHIKNNNESPKIEKSRSPSINNGDDSPKILKEKENLETFETEEYNEIKEKTIPLKEDEEEYIETSSYKNKNAIDFYKKNGFEEFDLTLTTRI